MCAVVSCRVYIHLDAIRPGEEADGPFSPDKVAAEFDRNKFAVALERTFTNLSKATRLTCYKPNSHHYF